ncbi:cytochrome c oxidase subunit I [Calycomorphotria hydatis]|uniref:Cytochrome c oxidase subunit 1 n=1 Tax=Calycomorphotria hydatis TaxID=2528027 RepID=A0A517T907_9PLAN|nr:cytochrome c oxidase subunit I [Calycomorphotria hydatis]QDT64838.1 Cytochrome c oxidase subunit 1 [Calycomorphotria hydatis]
MATTTLPQAEHSSEHPEGENYLNCSTGIASWVFTLDHKRIGVMYLAGVSVSFLLGGVFALLLRTELLTPGETIVKHDTYNQLFTLHGAIMTFLFIIPSIPAAMGNFILPIMLGAKDVAFPRMNLGSFYLWCIGAVFFVMTLLLGGLDTGWTFYTPYSTTTNTAVITSVMGVFILGFSSIFTGLNFIVTVHTMRPPGMTWFKMPLFLWAVYSTAIIQVLATPVLGITLLLLTAERVLGIGIFDPALGGDPVLFQHFFWFYSHPAVYIMILPAFGVISELISTFSRKPIFGYSFIAYSSIAIALLGFLVWGHHMFTSGQSPISALVFSALTFSVSIPSAIKVFNWLATMYKGSISYATPMIYALSFLFLFTIGGLTGLFLGSLATDVQLHDTYFVVAHFHYVQVGGTMIAFLGGLYYWWPKMTGKMYNELWGRAAAILIFLAFNLTYFPQFVMGSRGMPRRYYNYVEEYTSMHVMSTIGAYLLGTGVCIAFLVLLVSLWKGKKAPANPWGSATLEWKCSSPPPHHNFETPPPVGDPYAVQSVVYDPEVGGYVENKDYDPSKVMH